MKTELAIYRLEDRIYGVLLSGGHPSDLICGRQPGPHRQDIFLGKVSRLVPALDCAFVNIGSDHEAFLPLREAPSGIRPGQPIPVQVKKETAGDKGVLLSTRISLPGPYAVYRPAGRPSRRSRLADLPENEASDLFDNDLVRLEKLWQAALEASAQGPVPRCLLPVGDPLHHILLSLVRPGLEKILIEGDELFGLAFAWIRSAMPGTLPILALHVPAAGYGLAAVLGLLDLAGSLERRKIWLDSGGWLVIDRAEALTIIDVNSGRDIKGDDNLSLRLRTNNLAAAAIARQLRLRNLGGGILIDFLNLPDDAARAELAALFARELAGDRARTRILGFTGLGLLEMTRTAL